MRENTVSQKGKGKGEPLKVVLIGCGRVAEKHLRALRYVEKKGWGRLIAVVDPAEENARKRLRETVSGFYQQLPIYPELQSFFAEKEADIAAITTPSGSHAALALEALSHNCHLMIEKPLAMTGEDAEKIVSAAENAQKKVAIGHIYRYFPAVDELVSDITAGSFGRVLYGSVDVRWGHDQAYYDSSPWRGTRAFDGGVVMNQSIHALDLMLWLMQATSLKETRALCDTQNHRMESEDFASAVMRFDGDIYLNYEGSTSGDPKAQEAAFYLCCSEAEVRASLFRGKLSFRVAKHGGKNQGFSYLRRWLKKKICRYGLSYLWQISNPHTAIWLNLIEAIQTDAPLLADAHDGLRSIEVAESIYRSAGILDPGGNGSH